MGITEPIYYFEKTSDGTIRYELRMSPDWKIRYSKGLFYESQCSCYLGFFSCSSKAVSDENEQRIVYTFNEKFKYDTDSEIESSNKKINEAGNFFIKREISEDDTFGEFELRVISGRLLLGADSPTNFIYTRSNVEPFSYKAIDEENE